MTAVHSTPLPTSLDPLASQFSKLSTTSTEYETLSATLPPILDPQEIKKALFETSYEPSESLWAESQAAYEKPAEDPLPDGFPAKVSGPHIWNGKELFNKPEQWLHTFTAEEIVDVDNAIHHFNSLNLGFSEISRETFPLKVLNKTLDEAVDAIFNGIGLWILRGLPVQKYDRKSQIIAFAGIAAYIGEHRYRQIGSAAAIAHLRDLTKLDPGERPPIVLKGQTAGNQVFHTDAGDIIGLLTLGKAEKGGLSQLSSVGQLYNTFSDTRRDILRTLASPYYSRYDTEGSPIIHHVEDRVIAQYARRPFFPFFEDQSVADNVPPLTKSQHLALDALHFTAESASLDIDLQPGDLEFFNNLTVFHARTASEDSAENIRHLLRIWVRNESHQTPRGPTQKKFDGLEAGEVKFPVEKWPLEAWDVV
ncbi:hypothetical protein B0H11DRAFT_2304022 [Mycena galericulata]|nr:hypothetical protein B0H11DRAFT_2304022 [Mycena galericulata]